VYFRDIAMEFFFATTLRIFLDSITLNSGVHVGSGAVKEACSTCALNLLRVVVPNIM